MKPYECRWGGPATDGCWITSACGCMPTDAHEEHGPALVEDLRRTLVARRDVAYDRIDQICAWMTRRIEGKP